jgi:hypothetical protein
MLAVMLPDARGLSPEPVNGCRQPSSYPLVCDAPTSPWNARSRGRTRSEGADGTYERLSAENGAPLVVTHALEKLCERDHGSV